MLINPVCLLKFTNNSFSFTWFINLTVTKRKSEVGSSVRLVINSVFLVRKEKS